VCVSNNGNIEGITHASNWNCCSLYCWQQWKTHKLKLKLERYDRRVHVYEEVKRILSLIISAADVSMDELLKFRAAVAEADFLFGSEISKYLDEIYSHGVELWRWNREYRDITQEIPEGYNHNKVVEGRHNNLIWLSEQFEPPKINSKSIWT
jgi:hypothetical protein